MGPNEVKRAWTLNMIDNTPELLLSIKARKWDIIVLGNDGDNRQEEDGYETSATVLG